MFELLPSLELVNSETVEEVSEKSSRTVKEVNADEFKDYARLYDLIREIRWEVETE